MTDIRPISAHEVALVEKHIAFDWANSEKHRDRYARQQAGDVVYLVAWHEGVPVGHVVLEWKVPDDHPLAHRLQDSPNVEDLFVSPDNRSTGVRSRLVEAVSVLAKEGGRTRIGLGVDIDNPRARSLYGRVGFEDSGLGEYQCRWPWTDRDGRRRWAEESCRYLIKRL